MRLPPSLHVAQMASIQCRGIQHGDQRKQRLPCLRLCHPSIGLPTNAFSSKSTRNTKETPSLQASTTSEEERLGLDFGQLWQDRQKADTLALVERESVPKEGAAPIKFDSEFAQGCAL